ncbi:MAG: TIM44-like domain-containing protein [Taibaiella sp.]|nr:TIM44-like domain-containing protein [Taibaiella sp.]
MSGKFRLKCFIIVLALSSCAAPSATARVGGAGGHSSSGSHSSSHYSSSSSYGHYSSSSSGGGGMGPGGALAVLVITLVIASPFIIVSRRKNRRKAMEQEIADAMPAEQFPFPPGLDPEKIAAAFLAIQNAWQIQDLKQVRKWLSDGMYQRLTLQIKMMNALKQKNILSNIRIKNIKVARLGISGNYEIADVAIGFIMDDSFTSATLPQLDEKYKDDTAAEYWTFIKRIGSEQEKNLYDNANCPNCGALFETKMGEISRCSNCNTLTNNATYDWILSEITQGEDYDENEPDYRDLVTSLQNDPFFAVQCVEDIASNIFMQVMNVLSGADPIHLSRFADAHVVEEIMLMRQAQGPVLFDRLFLNDVTLNNYTAGSDITIMEFGLTVTYRRIDGTGQMRLLDAQMVTSDCTLYLARATRFKISDKETVFSFECSSCGAPYKDTTTDVCEYCGAPVLNKDVNWVLVKFDI